MKNSCLAQISIDKDKVQFNFFPKEFEGNPNDFARASVKKWLNDFPGHDESQVEINIFQNSQEPTKLNLH